MSYLGYFIVVIVIWAAVYVALRKPSRGPFDQFRESPFFDPKSPKVAMIWATLAAALAASYFLFRAA